MYIPIAQKFIIGKGISKQGFLPLKELTEAEEGFEIFPLSIFNTEGFENINRAVE
jgi:hypothetical protein